jgi:hypothetical protein
MDIANIGLTICALLLTVAAVLMIRKGGGESPGMNNYKLAGLLFLAAAAINWVLVITRLAADYRGGA